MRKLFRLKRRVKMLKDFYVFDTETGIIDEKGGIQWHLNGRPESFRFGVIYGYNYTKVIYSLKELQETLLESRFKKKIVFAHNLEYDGNTVYDCIYKLDPGAIFNGKLICFTNGNCLFADSTNIFGKIKLADVGKMLGLLKPDLGDSNLYSPNGITASEINRCIVDCQIVYDGLIQIFHAAGDIKITQAALAMTYYRRFHQPHDIEYNETTQHFFNSYFGGRTEAFKLGPTSATVIDVNSMYPYAMKVCKFPNPKYLKEEVGPKQKGQKKFIKYILNQVLPNYEGLIYCTVNHKKTTFGYLPYKSGDKKTGKKLIFPTGRFSGCWNFPEIKFALERGAIEIEEITSVVYAQAMVSPFVSFVDQLYDEKLGAKLDNNLFEEFRVKIFMNSLYGKFAQRIDEERIYLDDIDKHYDYIRECQRNGTFKKLMLFNSVRNDAHLFLTATKQFNVSYQIPSFASYITSFCRVLLLEKMLELEPKKVIYCDTDSIFFEINTGVKSELHLGGWKLEDKIVTEVNGLKSYKFEYVDKAGNLVKKNRIKGVPAKAVEISPNVYQYENLLKTNEALKRNLKPGVLTNRIKKIKGTYDKRIVLSNGETEPINL